MNVLIVESSVLYICLTFILIFFLFDILFFNHLNNNFLSIVFYVSSFIFFYIFLIYYDSYQLIHNLRFSIFLLLMIFIMTLISFFLVKYDSFKFINVFCLFFTSTFLISDSIEQYSRDAELVKLNFKYDKDKMISDIHSNDPLVLIILDELASNYEIYKKDTVNALITDNFKNIGFNIIDDFKTQSLSTKFSLPSLLNFNLHNNENELMHIDLLENNLSTVKKYDYLYRNSLLVDSLNSKNVTTQNFGLAPMSESVNHKITYPWYPRKITSRNFEIIKGYESLNIIANYTILKNFYLKFQHGEFDVYLNHNNDIWKKIITEDYVDNNFYYFHIMSPHEPYRFKTYMSDYDKIENKIDSSSETQSYINFREKVFNRLFNILKDEKFKKVRIIISSDHGYRKESEIIDPSSTMLFLKGFDINTYPNSVQDIGYLINSSFK